jgi:hypothetical protein
MSAGAAIGLALAGCGGSNQATSEPSGHFPVDVATATFPAAQTLAQHSDMVITVRNAGSEPIPDIAVTITDAGEGTAALPFAEDTPAPGQADPSRAVWILDESPCPGGASDACAPVGPGGMRQTGGPGGAVTAYANTWAMGRLAAGRSTTFKWGVTAVQPGVHTVRYQIAAGLNGKAKAVYGGGQPLSGTFVVTISTKPKQAYVNDGGQIVTQK